MKMINPGKSSLWESVTKHKSKHTSSSDSDQDPECTNLCKVLAVSTVQESKPCKNNPSFKKKKKKNRKCYTRSTK